MMEEPNDGKFSINQIIRPSYSLQLFCTKPKSKLAKTDLKTSFAQKFLQIFNICFVCFSILEISILFNFKNQKYFFPNAFRSDTI